MMINKDIIVISDFDNTITTEDVGNTILTHFSGGENRWIVEEYHKGNINSRACLECECIIARATENEFNNYIGKFRIDEHFKEFYQLLKSNHIPLYILSDGVDIYIKNILKRHSLDDIPFYSNKLHFEENHLIPSFPYYKEGCGLCGNCKLHHFKNLTQDFQKSIYIGDGHSDRYVVSEADVIFAKSHLEEYCQKNDIEYIPFNSFNDIINYFNGNLIIID